MKRLATSALALALFVLAWTDLQQAQDIDFKRAGGSAGAAQESGTVALTDGVATTVYSVSVPAGSGTGGLFHYVVFATDGTDHQTRYGNIRFAAVNKAGTETCIITGLAGVADAFVQNTEDGSASAVSAGSLDYLINCDTTPANGIAIQINAASSLAETTLQARYLVDRPQ